jgi:hypothetical protein
MEELLIKPGRHNNEFATVRNTPFKKHGRENLASNSKKKLTQKAKDKLRKQ